MSMFGRIIITAAVVAGVAHVFRRDLRRIVGALQKPTATFLADVKRELDSSTNKASEGVDKASIAAGAADDAKAQLAASKGESGSPAESASADKNEGGTTKMR